MKNKKNVKIAVVGASGNVGRKIISILHEKKFNPKNIIALASKKSQGKLISFGDDEELVIQNLEGFDFKDIDFALFSAGSEVSKIYAVKASEAGCIVIDNTSYFRSDPNIALIVPEINFSDIDLNKSKIIANPNCAIIPICLSIFKLNKVNKIKRIISGTYQSVSGAGKNAMNELETQAKALFLNNAKKPEVFKKPIAFNVIPQIDDFLDNGYTKEENKMRLEIKKIVDEDIEFSSTCVRVPVFIGHSSCSHVEFSEEFDLEDFKEILSKVDGLKITDTQDPFGYITPLEVVNKNEVFISRIRRDASSKNGLVFWNSSDNLRKGAALNAVQILERLI